MHYSFGVTSRGPDREQTDKRPSYNSLSGEQHSTDTHFIMSGSQAKEAMIHHMKHTTMAIGITLLVALTSPPSSTADGELTRIGDAAHWMNPDGSKGVVAMSAVSHGTRAWAGLDGTQGVTKRYSAPTRAFEHAWINPDGHTGLSMAALNGGNHSVFVKAIRRGSTQRPTACPRHQKGWTHQHAYASCTRRRKHVVARGEAMVTLTQKIFPRSSQRPLPAKGASDRESFNGRRYPVLVTSHWIRRGKIT